MKKWDRFFIVRLIVALVISSAVVVIPIQMAQALVDTDQGFKINKLHTDALNLLQNGCIERAIPEKFCMTIDFLVHEFENSSLQQLPSEANASLSEAAISANITK